jgi:hypothetical protein
VNEISSETYLAFPIFFSMIRIIDIIIYFSFTIFVFIYINFLYTSSENLDGEKEDRDYDNYRLIFF